MLEARSYGRLYARGILACVIGLSLYSLATTAFNEVKTSWQENRRLTPAPALPRSLAEWQRFPQAFEKFFNDNFGLRTRLLLLNSYLSRVVLGRLPTSSVIVGEDNWLFFTADQSLKLYQNQLPLSAADLRRWQGTLTQRKEATARSGVAYLFAVAPDKHTIYPEKMPRYLHRANRPSELDQLVAMATDAKLPLVDLRPALRAGKANDRLTYLKYDSHWNDWGGYLAYRAMIDALAPALPELKPLTLTYDRFAMQTVGPDQLAIMAMVDWTEAAPIFDGDPQRCQNEIVRETPIRGSEAAVYRSHCAGARYKILLLGDSFMIRLMKYFAPSFGEVVFVYRSYFRSFAEAESYIAREKPDVVIEEVVERHLPQWSDPLP